MGTLAVVALVGCGDDDGSGKGCDIRRSDCQERVLSMVARLRGSDFELPSIALIDEAEFIARAVDDEEPTDDGERLAALENRGLSLFGLAPQEYDRDELVDDVVSEIAAAYLPESREIVIIDRGEPMDDEAAVMVLAHEMVHAMQDAEFGLDDFAERWATDYDASLAMQALVEGEALHYQLMVFAELEGGTADDIAWDRFYSSFQRDVLSDAARDDAPVALASVRFPYAFGGALVAAHWRLDGREGIDALFEDPPRTTRAVMFGLPDVANEQAELRERGRPVLGEGFATVTVAHLGAWIAAQFAERASGADPIEALVLASGLHADVISIQYDADADGLVGAWRMRPQTTAQARDWQEIAGPLWGASDEATDELFLLSGEPEFGGDLGMLAWQDATDDEGEATMTAAVRMPAAFVTPLRHLGCAAAPRVIGDVWRTGR